MAHGCEVYKYQAAKSRFPLTNNQSGPRLVPILRSIHGVWNVIQGNHPGKGTSHGFKDECHVDSDPLSICVYPLTAQFGDGIMSAIDFRTSVVRKPDPKGDRVVITLDGKVSLTYSRRVYEW